MKHTHIYTIAFSAESNDPKEATDAEIIEGLRKRLAEVESGNDPVFEAVGFPEDTYPND